MTSAKHLIKLKSMPIKDKISQVSASIIGRVFNSYDLFCKRVKNRTPEGLKNLISGYILPYGAILVLAGFVILSQFTHVSAETVVLSSSDVMDLDAVSVAQVSNELSGYTPNLQEDSVSVVLAMKDQDFVEKPVVTETAQTIIAPPSDGKRKSTITYIVEGGDTLSSIGWKFGLKLATLKTANNLSGETIKPGQSLKIPPEDLSASQIAASKAKKKVAGASKVRRTPGSSNNAYPYGWCTYYVATRRYVPARWGDAKSWLSSARASGYATGSEPAAGAIVVTGESWYGHVAYVESVNGGSITISEMNYKGWGITSSRTISAHGGVIRGYIY